MICFAVPTDGLGVLVEVLGILAGICTCGASVPQLIAILRSKSAKGLSLNAELMLLIGDALWLTYGIIYESLAMIITNSFGTIVFFIIVVFVIRERILEKKAKKNNEKDA